MIGRDAGRSQSRNCLVGLSVLCLSAAALLSPAPANGGDVSIDSARLFQPVPKLARARATRQNITLANGVAIELLTRAGEFLGLGRIMIDGIVVRGGETPMTVYCVSNSIPSAALVARPMPPMHEKTLLKQVRLHDDGLGADIVTGLQMKQQPEDRLVWVIRGFEESWRGFRSVGFSYQFRFQGKCRPVHQIREISSWRLGDRVEGLLSIDRNDSYGRQSWATVIDGDTVIKGWSFPAQRHWPEGRFSTGDFVDFLSGRNVALVRYLDRPALTYKELSLQAGAREIAAREWYPTTATDRFQTPPMHIRLIHAGGVNAWIDARDVIRQRYVKQSGITPTPVVPGVINNSAAMTTDSMGKEYESITNPRAYIDWLVEHGLRRTWTWCRWKSAWTAWPHLGEADRQKIQQGLSHAVMTMQWDDTVVDLEKFRQMVEYGNQRGIDSMLWIPGGHLSKVSPLRRKSPSWIVKRQDGQPFTYVYQDIAANFYPAGYGQYMLDSLTRAHEQIPFTGIWLDSFQVFGLDVINYAQPNWPDQFDAAVDFVRQARKRGMNVGTECAFPLALPSSTGFYRIGELAGKEFLAYRVSQHFGGAKLTVTPQMYFRLVAWKGPPLLRDVDWKQSSELSRIGAEVNKAYNTLQPVMHRPRSLPNNAGVLWLDAEDRPAALFAFRDSIVRLDRKPKAVIEMSARRAASFDGALVKVKELKVYRIVP